MTKATTKSANKNGAGAAAGPSGKLGAMVELLTRPAGATLAQLVEATGWLPHSVRGALAGSLKKKHGLAISSSKGEGVRVYRAAAGETK